MEIFRLEVSHLNAYINTGWPVPDGDSVYVIADRLPTSDEEKRIRAEYDKICHVQFEHYENHDWNERLGDGCPCRNDPSVVSLNSTETLEVAMRRAGYSFVKCVSRINTTFI